MRKEWMEPVIEVQEFVANEYVAACGDHGTVYKFKCNAGDKNLGPWDYPYEYPYKVYIDSNNNGNLDDGDKYLSRYHACGATHEASVNDAFLSGFMVDIRPFHDQTPVRVIIWRGEKGDNTHCTINLNMSSWETAKS